MPTYTYDNFSKYIPIWEEHVLKRLSYLNKKESATFLDIGSGEGAATQWLLENLCGHTYSRVYSMDIWAQKETEKIFDKNISETGLSYKNVKVKGNIHYKLNELAVTLQTGTIQKFNLVYANCSTISYEAMPILLNSYHLLKENGIMIINNISTEHKINLMGGQAVHYRELIHFLTRLLAGQLEFIHQEKQMIIKKTHLHKLY